MNRIVLFLSVMAVMACLPVTAQQTRKLSRAASFWGLHFDRHSQLQDAHLGATLTEEMVDSMLRLARPDYIQVDSKGHPGVSSYPTEVGQQAGGYDKDPLALIRRVTDERNVALYVHYSGVMDMNYVRLHPDQARFTAAGKSDGRNASLWGNYTQKLLIPQLKEIALKYKVDGAWIDGESWAVEPDYQPAALAEFTRQTGITQIPRAKEDPFYKELLEFNRRKFMSYIKTYADEVHRVAPDFQICSNWAFSALMPERVPEDIGLDFLSGDYDPDNSLNTANWNVRALAGQGQPFDLMAWSFVRPNTPKTGLQLCQEAAAVISMGGGCQIYFRQNKDMSFQPASFPIMKEVADFMLPRRPFCKDISVVPQVGLIYSTAGWKKNVNDVYRPFGVEDIRGVMEVLLDGQQSVEVLLPHQLNNRMKEYPLLVVPEWDTLEAGMADQLKEYVKTGGRLLVIGSSSASQFGDVLGIKQKAAPRKIGGHLGYDGRFVNVDGMYAEVDCLTGTRSFARLYGTNDLRFPEGIVATTAKYGSGAAGGIYVDLGKSYLSSTSPVLRDLLKNMIAELAPELIVRVEGSHKLNVVTTTKDNNLLVQLINTSGDHANRNVKGIDEIPVLQNLKFAVQTSRKPRSVILQPEGVRLKYSYKNGLVNFTLPELAIHSVVEIAGYQ